jgi:hypothetical protein
LESAADKQHLKMGIVRRQKQTRVEILGGAGKFSLRAPRLWKQLKHEFESDPQRCEELEQLASVPSGGIFTVLAQELLAKTWFERRSPELAAAVERSGSVCRFEGEIAEVESAAVAKRLLAPSIDMRCLKICSSSLAKHDDTAQLILGLLNDELDRRDELGFPANTLPVTIVIERWLVEEWLKSADRSYDDYLTSLIKNRKFVSKLKTSDRPDLGGYAQRVLTGGPILGVPSEPAEWLLKFLPQLLQLAVTRREPFGENLRQALSDSSSEVIGQLAQLEQFDRIHWVQKLVMEYPKPPTADVITKIWQVWFGTRTDNRFKVLEAWNQPMQIVKGLTDEELTHVLESHLYLGRFDDLATRQKVELTKYLSLLIATDEPSVKTVLKYGINGDAWAEMREYLTDSVMQGTEANLSIISAAGAFDPIAHLSGKGSVEQQICEALEIVPDNEIARAMFFLFTSQVDKLLAFDPELEQLSLGYIASTDETRERLRPLMNAHPKLNVGRILASVLRQDRLARLKEKEVAYFVEQLIQRRDFESVWKLAQNHSTFTLIWILARLEQLSDVDEPLDQDFLELVRHAREILKKHTPDLLRYDPGPLDGFALAKANELSASNATFAKYLASIRFDGRVNDFSFSPDGLRLAVAGSNRVIGEVDLVEGKLRQKLVGFGASVGSIAFCGNRSIVAAERTSRNAKQCYVWICEEGATPRWVQRTTGSVTSAVSVGRDSVQYSTKDRLLGLIRLDESGSASKVANQHLSGQSLGYPRAIAENCSGELNVWFGESAAVIRNSDLSQVDSMHEVKPMMRRAAWLDDRNLVASDHTGKLHCFSVDAKNGNLRRGKSIPVSERISDFAVIPSTNELVIQTSSDLVLFRSDPPTHIASTGRVGIAVQISQDGSLMASGDEKGDIIIFDLSVRAIPRFASKPVGLTSPNDLPRYQRAAAAVLREKSTEIAIGPMRAITEIMLMLVHFRFRHDIFLDEPMTLRRGEYEIVLGGDVSEDEDDSDGDDSE